MTSTVLFGMGFGLGLFGLVRLLLPSQPPLAVALARIDRAAARSRRPLVSGRRPVTSGSRLERRLELAERLVGEQLAGALAARNLLGQDLQADLAILGVDERSYTARKLLLTAATLVLAPLVLTALASLAGVSWLTAAWASVLLAGLVFVLPDQRVKRLARSRRRDFTTATTAYLDLVAMRAAAGSGLPEALREAAEVGHGLAFERIRRALADAQLAGNTSGRALTRLGEQLGVVELVQLGGQLQIVSDVGSQAEESLRSKADALRSRQLTEAQSAANANSAALPLGGGLLAIGFLIIIAYPGLSTVLSL